MDVATSETRPEKSALLLEAILDAMPYPVWITDPDGHVILNTPARQLVAAGVAIASVKNYASGALISMGNRRFRYNKSEMNHGTNCMQHELRDAEDAKVRLERLERSTADLAACLAKRA